MTDLERLQSLMEALAALGELVTPWSPSRPPDAAVAQEIESFLAQYPFLRRDSGYVAFLKAYAGAWLKSREDMLSFELYGFSHEISLHLTDGEGDIVEDGFLPFGDIMIPLEPGRGVFVKTTGFGFGFPVTDQKRWGVYKITEEGSRWYCATFIEWLDKVVAARGRLLE